MKITQVTVSSHEKRNHPHEYGHADSEVTLTATIEADDDVSGIIIALRTMARSHVIAELDGWLAEIEKERRLVQLRIQIDNLVRNTRWEKTEEQLKKHWTDALQHIKLLPGKEQREHIDALNEAADACRESWRSIAEPDDDPLAF